MSGIKISMQRPRVEELLANYEDAIGQDFLGYRNHVYRAITYAMHFLGNAQDYEQLVETAFVYHDIGLWADHELAYLEPSEEAALADNEKFGWELDPDALRGAIHWHHKIFRYKGPHQAVIEACRKAHWIDASQGRIRKGLPRAAIKEVELAFENHGFHKSLLRLAKDYGGSTLVGSIKVTLGTVKFQKPIKLSRSQRLEWSCMIARTTFAIGERLSKWVSVPVNARPTKVKGDAKGQAFPSLHKRPINRGKVGISDRSPHTT